MAQQLKKKLLRLGVGIHKIETGSTEIGIPDLHVRTHRHDLWIELKEIKAWPKRVSTTIKPAWRPGQLFWIRNHQSRSGNAFVCITYQNDWYLLKECKQEYNQYELGQLSLIDRDIKKINAETLLCVLDNNCY